MVAIGGLRPHLLHVGGHLSVGPGTAAPAVFLDRDGVLNHRRLALVRRWEQFRFLPGVLDALQQLADTSYRIVIATNQDFVGAGYIRLEDLDHLHLRMVEEIERAGGRVDAVYSCVHARWVACGCRKPRPGMLSEAAERYRVSPALSWMVGDNAKDVLAGRAFGARGILVDSRWRTRLQGAERRAHAVARNLPEAVKMILQSSPGPRGRPAERDTTQA